MGFKPNPYDPCVVNKIMDEHQMTITWHVDDLKISHHDPSKIDEVAQALARIYGKIKIKQGRKHDYLGRCLYYAERGKLKASMKNYIDKIIEGFSEIIDKTAMKMEEQKS